MDSDPAQELVDNFKRKGHSDKLKRDLLNSKWNPDNPLSLEQAVKQRVIEVVKQMVLEDESLIFKNRGSTSALLEAQLYKEQYRKLDDPSNNFQLESIIDELLKDSELSDRIRSILEDMLVDWHTTD